MNILQRLSITIFSFMFIACANNESSKVCDSIRGDDIAPMKYKKNVLRSNDANVSLRDTQDLGYAEEVCNFIDQDVFVKEIKWAVLYTRDNNLMTLDSALTAFAGEWVSQDSIKKWWNH